MQISINIVASPALSDLIDDSVGRIVASIDRLAQAIDKLAAAQALAQSTSEAPAPITIKPETLALMKEAIAAPKAARPAPPETKAEPAPVPAPKPSSKQYVPIVKWSPERCQLAVDLRAEGKLPAAILLEVNKLPGEPIASADSVGVKLVELKKKGMRPTAKTAQTNGSAPKAEPLSPSALAQSSPSEFGAELQRVAARKAKLKEMWEGGVDVKEITAALNRMPGPLLVDAEVIRKAAAYMFLRPAHAAAPVNFENGGPATLEQIKQWFESEGGKPDVIPTVPRLVTAVNQMRQRLGKPPFELVAT